MITSIILKEVKRLEVEIVKEFKDKVDLINYVYNSNTFDSWDFVVYVYQDFKYSWFYELWDFLSKNKSIKRIVKSVSIYEI